MQQMQSCKEAAPAGRTIFVSQFLGTKDWTVSVQDGRQRKRRKKASVLVATSNSDVKEPTNCGQAATFIVSGNQTSNEFKNLRTKLKQLRNYVKHWRGNLELELKKRKEDASVCEARLKTLEDAIVGGDRDEGGGEGLDSECEERDLIREIMLQRDVLDKHRKKITEITDVLEGRSICGRMRNAQNILNGKKNCKIAYTLTTEQYAFKQTDIKFVLRYKFNDGKISFMSQFGNKSATIDGTSFTGESVRTLRKHGHETKLTAIAQAEIQLSNSLQTLHDSTERDIAQLRKKYDDDAHTSDKEKYKLIADEMKKKRFLGRLKNGIHKAEILASAYIVQRLDDLIVEKSMDIQQLIVLEAEAERRLKCSEWKKLPDMRTKRTYLGVAIGDGKLFAVGGCDRWHHSKKSGEYLNLENMEAGWKELPEMRTERGGLGVAIGDGKLFAVGGYDRRDDCSKSGEYLDLENMKAGWKELPDLWTGRGGLGVAIGDNKLFALGGYDSRHFSKKSGEYLDLENMEAGWKELPDMRTKRTYLGVAIGDSKLFAVGGYNRQDGCLKSGEYLDLENMEEGWKELPEMRTERRSLGMAIGDGKLFVVGGYDLRHDCSKSGEHLDLENMEEGWKELSEMRTERRSLGVAIGDGKLFAVGGQDRRDDCSKSGECLRCSLDYFPSSASLSFSSFSSGSALG